MSNKNVTKTVPPVFALRKTNKQTCMEVFSCVDVCFSCSSSDVLSKLIKVVISFRMFVNCIFRDILKILNIFFRMEAFMGFGHWSVI